MPLGTKGTDPVAIMIFLAVISLSGKPTFPYRTFCFPTIVPTPVNISTPRAFIELVKLLRILEARLFA
uniref:Uncharacterized protein n=1 Tax=Arundo donax TaxID=35708 RepID=A0A0A9DEP9_ARUDO